MHYSHQAFGSWAYRTGHPRCHRINCLKIHLAHYIFIPLSQTEITSQLRTGIGLNLGSGNILISLSGLWLFTSLHSDFVDVTLPGKPAPPTSARLMIVCYMCT